MFCQSVVLPQLFCSGSSSPIEASFMPGHGVFRLSNAVPVSTSLAF